MGNGVKARHGKLKHGFDIDPPATQQVELSSTHELTGKKMILEGEAGQAQRRRQRGPTGGGGGEPTPEQEQI